MKELQKIWDELPGKAMPEENMDAIVNRKSTYELDRFRKVLVIELYVAAALLVLFPLMLSILGKELVLILCFTMGMGTLLNIITIRKLNRIRLVSDVRTYLTSAIQFLRTFIIQFMASVQVIALLTLVIMKSAGYGPEGWMDWLFSSQGITLLALLALIEIVLLVYIRIFYLSRVLSLKKLLEEIGN